MIHLHGLVKRYQRNRNTTTALDGIDLDVDRGEFVCVRGPSGCGKSTLLLVAGGMLAPSAGDVTVSGVAPYDLGPAERAAFRADNIGFVFQTFHLVPYLDVTQNLMLAGGQRAAPEPVAADALLEHVGLAHRAHHLPGELSTGERQRTALARALLLRPPLLLADEPTGNLDPESGSTVLDLLSDYHRGGGTVVLVTHGDAGEQRAERVVRLAEGRILSPTQTTP